MTNIPYRAPETKTLRGITWYRTRRSFMCAVDGEVFEYFPHIRTLVRDMAAILNNVNLDVASGYVKYQVNNTITKHWLSSVASRRHVFDWKVDRPSQRIIANILNIAVEEKQSNLGWLDIILDSLEGLADNGVRGEDVVRMLKRRQVARELRPVTVFTEARELSIDVCDTIEEIQRLRRGSK